LGWVVATFSLTRGGGVFRRAVRRFKASKSILAKIPRGASRCGGLLDAASSAFSLDFVAAAGVLAVASIS
jgi:hypothetical protein